MLFRGLYRAYFDEASLDGAAGAAGAGAGGDVGNNGGADPAAGAAAQPAAAAAQPANPVAEPAKPAEQTGQPRDWAAIREAYAKGDEKLAKRLSRYSSVESAMDALIAAQNKIAAGPQPKSGPPEDATDAQMSEWRKENGIPDSFSDYALKMDDGTEITDDQKTLADSFLKAAHEANLDNGTVNKLFNSLMKQHNEEIAAAEEATAEARAAGESALRQEWGSEYKLNSQLIVNMLNTAPAEVKDGLLGATLPDGTAVAHSPAMMRWLANMARELNPMASITPVQGEAGVQAMAAEKAELVRMSGDYNSAYWVGSDSQRLQARLKDIISAEMRMQNK